MDEEAFFMRFSDRKKFQRLLLGVAQKTTDKTGAKEKATALCWGVGGSPCKQIFSAMENPLKLRRELSCHSRYRGP